MTLTILFLLVTGVPTWIEYRRDQSAGITMFYAYGAMFAIYLLGCLSVAVKCPDPLLIAELIVFDIVAIIAAVIHLKVRWGRFGSSVRSVPISLLIFLAALASLGETAFNCINPDRTGYNKTCREVRKTIATGNFSSTQPAEDAAGKENIGSDEQSSTATKKPVTHHAQHHKAGLHK